MSKTISIINAGNIFARNFLKTINGYNKIILGDTFNNRKSLLLNIKNLKENDQSTQIEHMNISNNLLLEEAIKNSHTVVFFTHDYFSLVEDKNDQLLAAAQLCKDYNVDKFITVNPIELMNYYSDSVLSYDPISIENSTHEKLLSTFEKSTILRPNLVFGTKSYIVRFLTQHWIENFTYFSNVEIYKHYRFNPLYSNDLNDVINLLVHEESNTFEGKKFTVSGTESYSFMDVDNMIRQTYASQKEHKEINKNLHKLASNWQMFFHGNTHITNIEYMLTFFQNRNPQFTSNENIMQHLGLRPTSFREYYTNKAEKYKHNNDILSKEREEDLRYPNINRYWDISLD